MRIRYHFSRALAAVAIATTTSVAASMAAPPAWADGMDIPEDGWFVPAGTQAAVGQPGDALGASWSLSHEGALVIGEDGKTQTVTWTQAADMLNRPPWPWKPYDDKITTASFAGSVSATGNPVGMFDMLTIATSIDCTGLDTSQVNDMVMMFAECYKLTDLTFGSKFDTSQVTNMSMMFAGDMILPRLDLSGFNTQNVTNMSMMLYANEGLTFLDASGLDTTNVTDMSMMFYDCPALRAVDFGDGFTFKGGTAAQFPELTEDDTYTGKWVPGSDPRATEGAKTAAELMGDVVSPKGLWVAQLKVEAATQEWESLIPQPAPDPEPNPDPTPDPEPDPEGSDDEETKQTEGDGEGEEQDEEAPSFVPSEPVRRDGDAESEERQAASPTTVAKASSSPLVQTGDATIESSHAANMMAGCGIVSLVLAAVTRRRDVGRR